MIGSLVGGYRVVTELGAGPSGSVYYAEHPVIGRRAAIKVLSPAFSGARDRLDRYITELKIVSSIRHPNIVDVLDIGQMPAVGSANAPVVASAAAALPPAGAEVTFIVMEMLEGETLGERLERVGALEEGVAVRILVQLASAVAAAHDRNLVHAAIKAENVFITNSVDYPDFVKVLDFGAYKLQAPGALASSPYLAPEVTAGAEPDTTADVYSAGILAYEMLVGTPPWQRAHEQGVARGERLPPLPPHERRPSVSKNLSTIVMRAITADSGLRWPSMRDFRRAIEGAMSPASAWAASAVPTALPEAAGPATPAEVQRTERVQAKKVGRALSNIILRRINENRLQLPSMPLVALKCLDVLRDPNVTFSEVARVIEQDPVIASRVLRVVNSAAYMRRHAVKTLEQAVAQIGVKPMRILLVEIAAFQVFTSRSPGIRQKFKMIWEHCLAVGMLSRDLSERLRSRVEPDTAYLGGLLHDIGKPIIGGLLLEAERRLIEELDVPWMTETLWQKTVAESHRSVGAAVAAAWKLPPEVTDAVENCDSYDRDAGAHSCANLVRFANTLAKREGIYVGDVSGDEIIAAVLQGRAVLSIDEATEATLIASLRDRTAAVIGGRTHRTADAASERGRRSRPS